MNRTRVVTRRTVLAAIAAAAFGAGAAYFLRRRALPDWSGWQTATVGGLAFAVPANYALTGSADPIAMREQGFLRFNGIVEIVEADAAAADWAADAETIRQSSVPSGHTLQRTEGGSGGPEYRLTIPKSVDGRTLAVVAYDQAEFGEPDFSAAWGVWDSLRAAE